MSLKAIKPHTIIPKRIKMMISGEPGSGKSWLSLSFPRPYLIDAESGCWRPQYQEKLKEVGGAYFGQEQGADNFEDVINEVRALCTEEHDYKTLIIDSFSHLYLQQAAEAELRVGSDFGKDKREANKPTRQLMRWINKVDMNVILIAHSKANWIRKGNEIYQDGFTFEGYSKLSYDLDLWIHINPGYKTFTVKKSRILSLQQGDSLPLSYEKFREIYGSTTIDDRSTPVDMSTVEEVNRVNELIKIFNIPEDTVKKWLSKADVEELGEMTQKQITGLIEHIESKTKGK